MIDKGGILYLLVAVLLVSLVREAAGACNVTLYEEWRDDRYVNFLSTDLSLWRYQTRDEIRFTKGLALDMMHQRCANEFDRYIRFRAGRMGPVREVDGYDAICSEYCQESDRIHVEAMTVSDCNCEELSTQPDERTYRFPGDFCRHNSARLQCEIMGFCGIWDCVLEDFMCPRYEYNKRSISWRGSGTCFNAGHSLWASYNMYIYFILMVIAAYQLM
jgi:hypothetical protein